MGSFGQRALFFIFSLGMILTAVKVVVIGGTIGWWLALLAFAVITLFWIVPYLASVRREYRSHEEVQLENIDDFLARLVDERYEYCLLLRPFGADGFLHLPTTETWYAQNYVPGRTSVIFEQILQSVVKEELGIDTVSVLDRNADLLPPGPIYIKGSMDWKRQVSTLITRALVVVFVFPPTRGSTPSIEWELLEALKKGMSGRLAVFLPPSHMKTAQSTKEILDSLLLLFNDEPHVNDFTEKISRIAMIHVDDEVRYWYEEDHIEKRLRSSSYRDMVKDLSVTIKANTYGLSHHQKYPYFQSSGARTSSNSEPVIVRFPSRK